MKESQTIQRFSLIARSRDLTISCLHSVAWPPVCLPSGKLWLGFFASTEVKDEVDIFK